VPLFAKHNNARISCVFSNEFISLALYDMLFLEVSFAVYSRIFNGGLCVSVQK
jgi:hypothetical protein